MSYRKVLCQGSIPFSWEDKPGVSKFKCPIDLGLGHVSALEKKSMPLPLPLPLPPPPPCLWERYFPKAPVATLRGISKKGLRWQPPEDPFLAAYKECTKSVRSGNGLVSASKRGFDFGMLKSLSIFSCKTSISHDVGEDNYVRLAHLPPLPKERIRMMR